MLLILTSCTSVSKIDYNEEMGTPENSVVFYGVMYGDVLTSFSQMDPKFGPDFQEFKDDGYIISKPVKPGSTYALNHSIGANLGFGVKWNSYFPINAKSLYIKMPTKPGLYYMGYYDATYATMVGRYVKNGYIPDENASRVKMLEKAKKKYAGTVWETVIDAEIEELKK